MAKSGTIGKISFGREEKERLIRELINIIERNEIIVGKVNDIKFLKVSN
jgi:hypothetical protein